MGTGEITRFPRLYLQGGFTLVETMTTLAVASILLTAAVPPMQDFVIRNRMSAEVNTFVASLHLARSEAVKRMQNVSLCPVDDSGNCDASSEDWEQGWKVYYTDNATGTDVVLQQNPTLPNRFKIIGNQNTFAYSPTGQLFNSGSNGTYTFCDTGGVAQARDVVVSSEGRVRTSLNETGC
jgi:type IV fimbrial biogenesis protein FimT